ncbi:hypothetical protein AMTRI_Chr03g139220 [Amborella trichopoda]|uniref:uncharacterized protein LOC110007748 n=1 Tax=Amborella trichopoda TaxID=13333 RepID=UPI0009BCDEE6|nr:uncharacterized protein LOC110007748 [Amborella trichopoda]|eukprot:XP_020526274.1 uncharacterized protein LOC110007748 [Amborella trichopoda]
MPEARDARPRFGARGFAGGQMPAPEIYVRRDSTAEISVAERRRQGNGQIQGSNKENMPPAYSRRSRERQRTSPLPAWYPRTPLRDITAIVRALERKRARERLAATVRPRAEDTMQLDDSAYPSNTESASLSISPPQNATGEDQGDATVTVTPLSISTLENPASVNQGDETTPISLPTPYNPDNADQGDAPITNVNERGAALTANPSFPFSTPENFDQRGLITASPSSSTSTSQNPANVDERGAPSTVQPSLSISAPQDPPVINEGEAPMSMTVLETDIRVPEIEVGLPENVTKMPEEVDYVCSRARGVVEKPKFNSVGGLNQVGRQGGKSMKQQQRSKVLLMR